MEKVFLSDVLKAIKKAYIWNDEISQQILERAMMQLPPADVEPPEQKTGEWIRNDIAEKLGIWLCSECEQPINLVNEWGEFQKLNYCPNCGAKMKGDK